MNNSADFKFFSTQKNQTALGHFRANLENQKPGTDFETNRNSHIYTIISSIMSSPQLWDEHCALNINWIGSSFSELLKTDQIMLSSDFLDHIFSMCFRFLLELHLSINGDLRNDLEAAKDFGIYNADSFEEYSKKVINYAIRSMPISMFKRISTNDSISSIKTFNDLSRGASTKMQEMETDLNNREERINILKDALEKYENAYNFVGLYDGFNELSKSKTAEANNHLKWLSLVAVIITIPLISEIVFIYYNIANIASYSQAILLSMAPTVSLIAVLVYYFRSILQSYRSAKSQLLQIELRKTLCTFIQHYSDYSSKIKKTDKDALDRFESIIFSGIAVRDEDTPTTLDSLEKLVGLLRATRS